MERLFRSHFWVVHCLGLAVAAFFCAQATNQAVGHVLRGTVQAPTGNAGGNTGAASIARDFAAAGDSNIFDGKREVVVEQDVPAEQTCRTDKDCTAPMVCLETGAGPEKTCQAPDDSAAPDLANAVRTELPIRLVGTSVFYSSPEDSLASILENGKTEAALYSINDCAQGPAITADTPAEDSVHLIAKPLPCNALLASHRIFRIEPDRVYFVNGDQNRTEYVAIDEPPSDAPKPIASLPPPPAGGGGDDEFGKGVTKVGPNKYEVTQAEVDNALGNLSKLATQARIVPAFEGGQPVGFKLFSIRPGSLYSKIGIQNGDILQKVNGYEITSPDKALEIYQKLREGKEFSVDIKRRGKPVSLEYGVTP